MDLASSTSVNRINLEKLESRGNSSLLREAAMSQPPQNVAATAPPANSSVQKTPLIAPANESSNSSFARDLAQTLSDLRERLGESSLASGLQFSAASASQLSSTALRQVELADQGAPNESDATFSPSAPASVNDLASQSFDFADALDFTDDSSFVPREPVTVQNNAAPSASNSQPEENEQQEPNLGDATLSTLSTSLNLQSAAGRFQIDVNGQTLNFRADQTLNDVLTGLSAPGTGVRASLDPRERRIDIESTNGRPLSINDREGNLSSGLGIEVTPSENTNASLSRDLQDFAQGLNRAITTLERADSTPQSREAEQVLNELKSALNGLFAPSRNGQVNGLGDLGFSRENGEVQFDESRLNSLVQSNPDEVNRVAGSLAENAAPILRSGERVAREIETSVAEAKASTQEVKIFGEIQRLQVRQQTLELDRVSIDRLRNRVSEQGEFLARVAENLEDRLSGTVPKIVQETKDFARDVAASRPRRQSAIAFRPPDPPLGNVGAPNSSFVLARDRA